MPERVVQHGADDLPAALLASWDRLTSASVADVYTSRWWSTAAWQELPDLGSGSVVALYEDEELVAMVPLTVREEHGGSRLIAPGSPLGDSFDVRTRPGSLLTPSLSALLLRGLLNAAGEGGVVELKNVRRDSILCALLTQVRPLLQTGTSWELLEGTPTAALPLGSGPRSATHALSSHRRRNLNSRRRRLATQGHLRLSTEARTDLLMEAIPGFLRLRLARWTQRNRIDELPDIERHPAIDRFLQHLVHAARGSCLLVRLHLDDRELSAALCFRHRRSFTYYMSTYDPAFAAYGPGLITIFLLAEQLASEGYQEVDLGRGDEAYKLAHGARVERMLDFQLRAR
jgi:CelD/BcsL family acetyltransferase involved in cellulose biosynthesis